MPAERDLAPRQRWMGCVTVGIIICVNVTCTSFFSYLIDGEPTQFWDVVTSLMYLTAVVAIFCHGMLLWMDPGVVPRTQETCMPIPDVVAERIRAGETLEDVDNLKGSSGTYCVRCCVWRRPLPPKRMP